MKISASFPHRMDALGFIQSKKIIYDARLHVYQILC